MRALAERWHAYWFRAAPLADLAVLRWLAVGFQLAWMLAGGLEGALDRAAARPATDHEPVLLARLLGGAALPSEGLLQLLHDATLACGALACVGLATRVSLPLFTLGVLYLQAHAYSFGFHHHAEAALAIVLVALSLAPSGGALSLDRWLAERRAGVPLGRTSELARWPILVARWTVVLVFLSAGLSKLGRAGLEWANGSTLQYCAFVKGAKLDTPLGVWLSGEHELCRALSWIVLAFESTFALVLVLPALAWLYVPLAVALVVGIHLTIGAGFYQLLVLCAAFVPWSDALRRLRR